MMPCAQRRRYLASRPDPVAPPAPAAAPDASDASAPRDTGPAGCPGSSTDVKADAAAAAQHPADSAAASLPSDSRFTGTATTGTGCVTPASNSAAGAELQTTSETGVAPWGQWDSFADAENAVPACSAPLTPPCAPAMPCQPDDSAHRHKLGQRSQPFNACVARPASKTEIASALAAQKAMKVEWGRLHTKRVWDERDGTREG